MVPCPYTEITGAVIIFPITNWKEDHVNPVMKNML